MLFFIFLGVPRHYVRRSCNCCCKACSSVRGRGHGYNSCDANLMVQGCTHTKQTFWTEDQFVLTTSSGIRDRDTRVAEIVTRESQKGIRTGSRALVTEGTQAGASWTLLDSEVWEGSWNHELCREGVQGGHPQVRGVQRGILMLPRIRWQWSSTLQSCALSASTSEKWYHYSSRRWRVETSERATRPSNRFTE